MRVIHVTVVGNVATPPVLRATPGGHLVASFRVACTSRRFDKDEGRWRDGDTVFTSVSCWRELGENVAQSLSVGDGVVVQGTLSQREYVTATGETRSSLEVTATAVGPDLSRGVAKLARSLRVSRPSEPVGEAAPADSAVPVDSWQTEGDRPGGDRSEDAETEDGDTRPEPAGVAVAG